MPARAAPPRPPMSAADALARAFDALPGLAERLDDIARTLDEHARADALRLDDGLHPDHAYSPEQCAAFLGVAPQSVRRISPELLPRVRSGRVLGIDLLAYRGDIGAADAAAYKRATRDRVLARL